MPDGLAIILAKVVISTSSFGLPLPSPWQLPQSRRRIGCTSLNETAFPISFFGSGFGDEAGDVAKFGVGGGSDYDGDGGTGGDTGSGEHHVYTVTEGDLFQVQFLRLLLGGLRFASEGGFDAAE